MQIFQRMFMLMIEEYPEHYSNGPRNPPCQYSQCLYSTGCFTDNPLDFFLFSMYFTELLDQSDRFLFSQSIQPDDLEELVERLMIVQHRFKVVGRPTNHPDPVIGLQYLPQSMHFIFIQLVEKLTDIIDQQHKMLSRLVERSVEHLKGFIFKIRR